MESNESNKESHLEILLKTWQKNGEIEEKKVDEILRAREADQNIAIADIQANIRILLDTLDEHKIVVDSIQNREALTFQREYFLRQLQSVVHKMNKDQAQQGKSEDVLQGETFLEALHHHGNKALLRQLEEYLGKPNLLEQLKELGDVIKDMLNQVYHPLAHPDISKEFEKIFTRACQEAVDQCPKLGKRIRTPVRSALMPIDENTQVKRRKKEMYNDFRQGRAYTFESPLQVPPFYSPERVESKLPVSTPDRNSLIDFPTSPSPKSCTPGNDNVAQQQQGPRNLSRSSLAKKNILEVASPGSSTRNAIKRWSGKKGMSCAKESLSKPRDLGSTFNETQTSAELSLNPPNTPSSNASTPFSTDSTNSAMSKKDKRKARKAMEKEKKET